MSKRKILGFYVINRKGEQIGWFHKKRTAELYAKMHKGTVQPELAEAA